MGRGCVLLGLDYRRILNDTVACAEARDIADLTGDELWIDGARRFFLAERRDWSRLRIKLVGLLILVVLEQMTLGGSGGRLVDVDLGGGWQDECPVRLRLGHVFEQGLGDLSILAGLGIDGLD